MIMMIGYDSIESANQNYKRECRILYLYTIAVDMSVDKKSILRHQKREWLWVFQYIPIPFATSAHLFHQLAMNLVFF